MSDDRVALAAEAYVYGYPLVFDLESVLALVHRGLGGLAAGPFNEFVHATTLAGPADTFVSVNNDTIYSIAQLDLSGGPLRLHLPDTGGAYDVFQFVDAWTNNFAYLGRRATGTGAADYLLLPPGTASTETNTIEVPTMVATIVGRFACAGPEDMARVQGWQRELRLAPVRPDAPLAGVPHPDERVPDGLQFFEKLRLWLTEFRPSSWDQEYEERFAPLGLMDDGSPYLNPDPGLAADLVLGLKTGQQRVDELTRVTHGAKVNGWLVDHHAFDYNLDHFQVGTLNSPLWKMPHRIASYAGRALAARMGLWGNHGYEATYLPVFEDSTGQQLSGTRSYTLRFAAPPPVQAFWSVTMYSMPDYYLVDNLIDRYSVGDRTTGLHYAADGSLTLVLQHEAPTDPVELANWLPTPAGEFRPLLRLYQPSPEALDGSYEYPPIVAR